MNPALTTHPSSLVERPALASLLLLFGAVVTGAATLAGNGNMLFGLIPVGLAAGAYAFCVLPIRDSLLTVIFLSLALDAVAEGPWTSPLAPLGNLLVINLNKSLPIGALALPGSAVLLAAMVALLIHRSFVGNRTDSLGRTPTARPLFAGLAVSFVTVMVLIGVGALHGGNVQMAKSQVQTYIMLLFMAYVSAMSLRDVHDYRRLGQVIVAAAVIRSFYVMYVVYQVLGPLPPGEKLHVAATHGDSLLFAAAAVLLVVRFMEQPTRHAAAWCALLLPILAMGMSLNGRRIVWVEVAAGLVTYALVSRRSQMKRFAANATLLALPLIVGYVAAGWNSQAKIFAPISMYRSVTDGQIDSSTLYRDLENFNLMMTMRIYPMTGMGFGQPFVEEVVLPNISFFVEYRYMPHNSILGLWAYTGPLGFTGLTMALVIAMYFAIRSYRLAEAPDERIAAVMVVAMLAIYFAHCWGDIGFSERRTLYLVGPALAVAGQLAYRTGAYKTARRNPPKVEEARDA